MGLRFFCRLFAILIVAISLWGCDSKKPFNVLIVSFDTTRADHIGAYGKGGNPTPHIDALASKSSVFEMARTAIPITLPSHSTIMTGMYPPGHGVRDNGVFVLEDSRNRTLAEILQDRGYRTGAAVASFPLMAQFGLDQGFTFYDDQVQMISQNGAYKSLKKRIFFDERKAESVNAAIIPWLHQNQSEPFFAFVHYFDPHQPWEAPAEFASKFADDGYVAEIAYADAAFGQLLDTLRELDALENTIIVFTSDHGEGLGEHKETTHSLLNYDSTLHVPLVISVPGLAPRRIDRPVGTVDIVPTVLDILGIEQASNLQGISLLPLMQADQVPEWYPDPEYYAETLSPRIAHGWGELRTIVREDFKYIHGPRPELFQVSTDPDELHDLLSSNVKQVMQLHADLKRLLASIASQNPVQMVATSQETIARLQALGYIQGDGDNSPVIEELREDGVPPQDRVNHVGRFSKVKQLLAKKEPHAAFVLTEQLLSEDSKNETYRMMAANALYQMNNLEEALYHLEELAKIKPVQDWDISSIFFKAGLLRSLGNNEKATEIIEVHQTANPSSEGLMALGQFYASNGMVEKAVGAYAASLNENSGNVFALNALAILHAQHGNINAAKQLLQEAEVKQPFDAQTQYNLGVLALQENNTNRALHRFQKAIKLQPFYMQARYAAGQLHVQQNDMGQAKTQLNWMLTRNPDHSLVHDLQALVE